MFCDRPHEEESASTIIDHIDSFGKYSYHDLVVWSKRNVLPDNNTLASFDCLIIHYSISLLYDRYVSRQTLEKIKTFNGLKILFIQDEYRRVNFACKKINYAEIDLVYSCAPMDTSKKMYEGLNQDIILKTTLTGYVPEKLYESKLKPISGRKIHVGYRARKCPFFLGRKGYEKYLIGRTFLKYSHGSNLICDISSKESDRLYGKKWTEFISNCRTTLGTESGSSIIDFTGEIEYDLNFYQAFHPFACLGDLPKKYLSTDGKLEIQVISPRCFEAAALGTVMVLFPGNYSGVLIRDKHYVGLEKDFSNVDEVIDKINDDNYLQEMSDFAHSDLVQSKEFSYEKFIQQVDKDLDELIVVKNFKPTSRKETNLSLEIDTYEKSTVSQNSMIRNFFHKVWKILPEWIRFILMVTVLRKKYFCHFNKVKYSYLNS